MTKHRISDTEASALLNRDALRGDATGVSPELSALAESLSDFRAAAFETTPRPSAELMARLDLSGESKIAASTMSIASGAVASAPVGEVSRQKRIRRMISWFAGLGVLAKIALGSTVAAAAVVGAGAGGVLPGGAQDAFNTVVSAVVPTVTDDPESTPSDSPSPDATSDHPDNFGGTVSEWAHDPNKGADGPFGLRVSDAAHEKNAANDGSDDGDTDETGTDESDGGTADNPTDHGGKPEGTGGGKGSH
jgi:hypothetical protein